MVVQIFLMLYVKSVFLEKISMIVLDYEFLASAVCH
jgi:hypothetical protein